MADTTRDTSGYSYAENEVSFKQNQLKLSSNRWVFANMEKYRFKEMVDSFNSPERAEWVDELLQLTNSADEINQDIIELYVEEVTKLNESLPDGEKILIDTEKPICLTPTVHRFWSEAKNICQLSKSIEGIAVKTANTQKLIQMEERSNRDFFKREDENKRGLLGFGGKKPEQLEKERDLYA
jgi:hypothetical protein